MVVTHQGGLRESQCALAGMADGKETVIGNASRSVGHSDLPDGAGAAPTPERADAVYPSASHRETRALRRRPLAARFLSPT